MKERTELDEVMLSKLRSMETYDRVALGMALNEALRKALEAVIRALHPNWTETEVKREISFRFLSGDVSVDGMINCSFALSEPRHPKAIASLIR